MLSDIERKLLRILYNFFAQQRRMPTMQELEIKTGRRTEDIRAGLLALEKDNYILWDDKSSLRDIVIIEGWERGQIRPMSPGDATRYFTEY
ncbi:hypothetical protein HFE03_03285 [Paenibacillus sp. EKM102P]|uniref:hypothetical protein n=1 Tax=unclassified Paenibacillus TaxID=185978 RepID=UPI00142D3C3C|nr:MULTISPECIES: hypothetical protein [unclassified Paenibacillus]KAF6614364.1 hypothetical protein HFE00_25325 [Paenibacillus sp. EKM101P]KAF6624579.1 hypothetical protein HFE03_03285 [Paenibacillus sp. EKM102P]KAF6635642.1 hypothetical protein HFE01_01745 [Paenibacillus sp. EKM10P]KAF6648648.1 hypothetical protein HFE02_09805 [Paenibacillus sp. EKM11P]